MSFILNKFRKKPRCIYEDCLNVVNKDTKVCPKHICPHCNIHPKYKGGVLQPGPYCEICACVQCHNSLRGLGEACKKCQCAYDSCTRIRRGKYCLSHGCITGFCNEPKEEGHSLCIQHREKEISERNAIKAHNAALIAARPFYRPYYNSRQQIPFSPISQVESRSRILNLMAERMISHSFLPSRPTRQTSIRTDIRVGDMLSLPKHLIKDIWSPEITCVICLEHMERDSLKISVCCGQKYCVECFSKLDKCAMCRRNVVEIK